MGNIKVFMLGVINGKLGIFFSLPTTALKFNLGKE